MITDLRKLKPDVSMLRTLRGRWRQHPRYRNCQGHWLIYERGGAVAYDLSGQDQHGTLTGMDLSTDWVTGRRGPTLNFNGTTGFVSLPVLTELSVSNPYTLSAWFKADTTDPAGVLEVVSSAQGLNDRTIINISNNILRTLNYDGAFAGASTGFTDTADFHHAVLTHDGSSVTKGYLDGAEISGGDFAGTGFNSHFNIGNGPVEGSGLYFDGLIDDVRFYNRVLPNSEIQSLYYYPFLEFDAAKQRLFRMSTLETSSGPVFSIPVVQHSYRRRRVA